MASFKNRVHRRALGLLWKDKLSIRRLSCSWTTFADIANGHGREVSVAVSLPDGAGSGGMLGEWRQTKVYESRARTGVVEVEEKSGARRHVLLDIAQAHDGPAHGCLAAPCVVLDVMTT